MVVADGDLRCLTVLIGPYNVDRHLAHSDRLVKQPHLALAKYELSCSIADKVQVRSLLMWWCAGGEGSLMSPLTLKSSQNSR